jgi:hypothetical protein
MMIGISIWVDNLHDGFKRRAGKKAKMGRTGKECSLVSFMF